MNLQVVDHYLCQECTVVQTKLLKTKNIEQTDYCAVCIDLEYRFKWWRTLWIHFFLTRGGVHEIVSQIYKNKCFKILAYQLKLRKENINLKIRDFVKPVSKRVMADQVILFQTYWWRIFPALYYLHWHPQIFSPSSMIVTKHVQNIFWYLL